MIVHFDIETRSAVDLFKRGVSPYARHHTTDIAMIVWKVDDGPLQGWINDDVYPDTFGKETKIPQRRISDFFAAVDAAEFVYAHNATFERRLMKQVGHERYGWPEIPLSKYRCTMAIAHSMTLPGSLESLCKQLRLNVQKDLEGAAVMRRLCKPESYDCETGKPVWITDANLVLREFEYCGVDVLAEYEVTKAIKPLSRSEQRVWVMDQEINDNGFMIDLHAVQAAQEVVELEMGTLNERIAEATGGVVTKVTQAARIKKVVQDAGAKVTSLSKRYVAKAIEAGDLPPEVLEILGLRAEGGKSSTSKLAAMINRADDDWRIRDAHVYHKARTGRWAGAGVQTQNLTRRELFKNDSDIEGIIRILKDKSLSPEQRRDELAIMYGPPVICIAESLRGMIVATPGHRLIAFDFSSIEARLVSWAAGEGDVLELYEKGADVYIYEAAQMYKVDPSTINKKDPRRQEGKVAVLALGYGGGENALSKMAEGYGMELPLERRVEIVARWRLAHPKVTGKRYPIGHPKQGGLIYGDGGPLEPGVWHQIEKAMMLAIEAPGTLSPFFDGKGAFVKSGAHTYMKLPSGRYLTYPHARINTDENGRKVLEYWGTTQTSDGQQGKEYAWQRTWGGTLFENFVQAMARDLLVRAIIKAREAGLKVIMHVHDELVGEARANEAEGWLVKLKEIFRDRPSWAKDLPLDGEGWVGVRFKKG